MANENDFEILISFGLDATQARAAVAELNKLKAATVSESQALKDSLDPALVQSSKSTADLGEKAEHLAGQHKLLSYGLRALPEQLRAVGHAGAFLLTSLPVAAVAGLVFVFKK